MKVLALRENLSPAFVPAGHSPWHACPSSHSILFSVCPSVSSPTLIRTLVIKPRAGPDKGVLS